MQETILQSVGKTPLVRLRRVTEGLTASIYAKVESQNPGGSVKDRVALAMVSEAERRGWLRPGGTIIEATAGNTGVGLAMVAAVKGYRCIFVLPDKMSAEKISLLRAYGAETVITPTNVPPDSPDSYNGVADRLAREIPGAWRPNQFTNLTNPEIHYRTTGTRNLGANRGPSDGVRGRRRHRRHHLRRGPLSQGAESRNQNHRRRSRRFGPFRRHSPALEGRGHRRRFHAQNVQRPAGR